jgi:hypothetical protein
MQNQLVQLIVDVSLHIELLELACFLGQCAEFISSPGAFKATTRTLNKCSFIRADTVAPVPCRGNAVVSGIPNHVLNQSIRD